MSSLKTYLNHLTSKDYKLIPSREQETIKTYLDTSYSSNINQKQITRQDSILSQGFSFSGSDKQKESQSHWQAQSAKYISHDPKRFITKAQTLMQSRHNSISVNGMKEIMNEALEILTVVEQDKSQKSKQFVDKLMVFLQWVQERIQSQKTRSTQRRISKEEINIKCYKKRQFYDKNGKVTIEIRKILPSKNTNRK